MKEKLQIQTSKHQRISNIQSLKPVLFRVPLAYSKFGIWIFFGSWLLVLGAFDPVLAEEKIPPLLPPHGELQPTYWQQHEWQFIGGAMVVLILMALMIWLLLRPKPVIIQSPAIIARRALEPLRGQPEDGKLVVNVSRIIRRYVLSALNLPLEEFTTTEFRELLASQSQINSELSTAVGDFLRRCDQWKFAPQPPAAQLGAVPTALELVTKVEQSFTTRPVAHALPQI